MILIFFLVFLIFALLIFLYNACKCQTKGEPKLKQLQFIDEYGSFTAERPENISYLYFPLASETGLKSSVTPNLGGDSKLDQESFLLEPVSAENLHNNRSTRNFWLASENGGIFSVVGSSARQEDMKFTSGQDESRLTAGFMWHTMERVSHTPAVRATVTSFIPADENAEIMHITICNTSDFPETLTPYAAVPVYGRSADNIRDHRNVTSMLHRIKTDSHGVLVCPTMSFDERGHRPNHRIYYVYGYGASGQAPECFYPTAEDFLGEGGTYTHPRAVYEHTEGVPPFSHAEGKEAMGAFRFPRITLMPGQTTEYVLIFGIEESESAVRRVFSKYDSAEKTAAALEATRSLWRDKVNVGFHTGSSSFDGFMKWVCFQPFLRRLFGCSFLPHHDYGRGGRGWRDLWQDCLSLLLMDPDGVGQMIEKNFGGVRVDGTNATIIGAGDGNFIADRNGIARVWMDHALWPQMTTRLYIDQTGDTEILNRQASYFKDSQCMRGTATDTVWEPEQGSLQRTEQNEVYTGSILEHLLIQQLTSFYEVGDHNICRLRGADWNDALDMAEEHGESVAFTCAYAGNLRELAEMIRLLESRSRDHETEVMEELGILLNDDPEVFGNIQAKQEILDRYVRSCRRYVSGRRIRVRLSDLARNLERKADWLSDCLKEQEWISGENGEGWFNSYYDDHGHAVEGFFPDGVRMMLTGQVFAIMGNVATESQISSIVRSADHYLYRKEIGGYRLNTDFHELKFDMGRMFGFAYGEKENGAVFSHMTVMFANALYRRGFAREGWKALKTLAETALDFDTSRIYPGIPEYFRADGRGMYHYLTGAASWYMLTMVTQVFGVRGEAGDLIFDPKLCAEQLDEQGRASVCVSFAGRDLEITYENTGRKEYGDYATGSAICGGVELPLADDGRAIMPRRMLDELSDGVHHIIIKLI